MTAKYQVTNVGPSLRFWPDGERGKPLDIPHTAGHAAGVELELPDSVVAALGNTGGQVRCQRVRERP